MYSESPNQGYFHKGCFYPPEQQQYFADCYPQIQQAPAVVMMPVPAEYAEQLFLHIWGGPNNYSQPWSISCSQQPEPEQLDERIEYNKSLDQASDCVDNSPLKTEDSVDSGNSDDTEKLEDSGNTGDTEKLEDSGNTGDTEESSMPTFSYLDVVRGTTSNSVSEDLVSEERSDSSEENMSTEKDKEKWGNIVENATQVQPLVRTTREKTPVRKIRDTHKIPKTRQPFRVVNSNSRRRQNNMYDVPERVKKVNFNGTTCVDYDDKTRSQVWDQFTKFIVSQGFKTTGMFVQKQRKKDHESGKWISYGWWCFVTFDTENSANQFQSQFDGTDFMFTTTTMATLRIHDYKPRTRK